MCVLVTKHEFWYRVYVIKICISRFRKLTCLSDVLWHVSDVLPRWNRNVSLGYNANMERPCTFFPWLTMVVFSPLVANINKTGVLYYAVYVYPKFKRHVYPGWYRFAFAFAKCIFPHFWVIFKNTYCCNTLICKKGKLE